jgi:hypothetical protein
MKALKIFGFVIIAFSLFGIIGAQLTQASFTKRAKVYQRIERTKEAELFGEVGTKIGSPQALIIDDQKAILPEKLEDGTPLISENYLKENNIYPLQLKTIKETTNLATMASIGALVIGTLFALFANKKLKTTSI